MAVAVTVSVQGPSDPIPSRTEFAVAVQPDPSFVGADCCRKAEFLGSVGVGASVRDAPPPSTCSPVGHEAVDEPSSPLLQAPVPFPVQVVEVELLTCW
jgi:hypothetical protein